mgnify:CR=1 FL=1
MSYSKYSRFGVRAWVFALVMWLVAGARGELIRIEGPSHYAGTTQEIEGEYYRLWNALAPHRPTDTSTLAIVFYSESRRTEQAPMLPEWGGGGTIGDHTILVSVDKQPVFARNVHQVVVHEMVHAILNRAYPELEVPRWYHEGCAMLLSGELSFQGKLALSRAVLTGRLLPLDAIDSVNAFSPGRAALAYNQSHACMQFLVEVYGRESIHLILESAEQANSFYQGLRTVLGLEPGEFDVLAENRIRRRYGFAFILGDLFLLWFVLALLVILAYAITRIRNARREREPAEPEQSEQPEEPDED